MEVGFCIMPGFAPFCNGTCSQHGFFRSDVSTKTVNRVWIRGKHTETGTFCLTIWCFPCMKGKLHLLDLKNQIPYHRTIHAWKLTSPLKIDGWKIFFFQNVYFQGQTVSSRHVIKIVCVGSSAVREHSLILSTKPSLQSFSTLGINFVTCRWRMVSLDLIHVYFLRSVCQRCIIVIIIIINICRYVIYFCKSNLESFTSPRICRNKEAKMHSLWAIASQMDAYQYTHTLNDNTLTNGCCTTWDQTRIDYTNEVATLHFHCITFHFSLQNVRSQNYYN